MISSISGWGSATSIWPMSVGTAQYHVRVLVARMQADGGSPTYSVSEGRLLPSHPVVMSSLRHKEGLLPRMKAKLDAEDPFVAGLIISPGRTPTSYIRSVNVARKVRTEARA